MLPSPAAASATASDGEVGTGRCWWSPCWRASLGDVTPPPKPLAPDWLFLFSFHLSHHPPTVNTCGVPGSKFCQHFCRGARCRGNRNRPTRNWELGCHPALWGDASCAHGQLAPRSPRAGLGKGLPINPRPWGWVGWRGRASPTVLIHGIPRDSKGTWEQPLAQP